MSAKGAQTGFLSLSSPSPLPRDSEELLPMPSGIQGSDFLGQMWILVGLSSTFPPPSLSSSPGLWPRVARSKPVFKEKGKTCGSSLMKNAPKTSDETCTR